MFVSQTVAPRAFLGGSFCSSSFTVNSHGEGLFPTLQTNMPQLSRSPRLWGGDWAHIWAEGDRMPGPEGQLRGGRLCVVLLPSRGPADLQSVLMRQRVSWAESLFGQSQQQSRGMGMGPSLDSLFPLPRLNPPRCHQVQSSWTQVPAAPQD